MDPSGRIIGDLEAGWSITVMQSGKYSLSLNMLEFKSASMCIPVANLSAKRHNDYAQMSANSR